VSGPLRFAWDERKNAQNRRKHGISFKEAQTVFFDEQALLISDPDHSEQEKSIPPPRTQQCFADAARLPLLSTQ
jgi:hypothetical protein